MGFMQKNKFSFGRTLPRVIAGAALLIGLMVFPRVSAEGTWEIFDTVAGFPMTVTLDAALVPQLAQLDGKKITLLGECPGGTVEVRSYVEDAAATFAIGEQWTTKAGPCTFTVIDHEAKQLASGSSEIFPDVIASKQLEIVDGASTLTVGEEAEFRAGFFDQYGNPAASQIVLLSSDASVESGEEDAAGYRHFTVLPERGGEISFTVVETLTGESKRFTFTAEDPAAMQQQQVLQNPAVGGTQSTVTQLLGELIRASLLSEYQTNGTTVTPGNTTSLVDAFDVVIGDGASTIRVNEQMDLVITALDQDDRKVENYVDSVVIETSDTDAVIPTGAIRFKATDRGRKVLSLAIMFQTPGEQTLTVRDEADPEGIVGEATVWVLGSASPATKQTITIQETPPVHAGGTLSIEGSAPAYINLHLYQVSEDGEEKRIAETSSDAEGAFAFEVHPAAAGSLMFLVRDPEGHVKDSATIMVEVEEETPADVPPVVNPPATIIPSVTGLTAGVDDGDVLLRWNAVPVAARYRIYFGPSANDLEQSVETNEPTTNIRLTGLRSGRTYVFSITALLGNGEESAEKSPIVTATLRGPLFDLTAEGIPNGVQLHFTAPPGVAIQAYRVRYGVQAGMLTEERILQPGKTDIVLMDLMNGISYLFSLDALLDDGNTLSDGAEISATPGQNGLPGLFFSPADPLPPGIGGGGMQGTSSSISSSRDNGQHAAAPLIPASGGGGLWWIIGATLLFFGGFGILRFQR